MEVQEVRVTKEEAKEGTRDGTRQEVTKEAKAEVKRARHSSLIVDAHATNAVVRAILP